MKRTIAFVYLLLIAFNIMNIPTFVYAQSAAIQVPCIDSPEIDCSQYQTSNRNYYNEPSLFEDIKKEFFVPILVACVLLIGFLIYIKNRKDNKLGVEKLKVSIWNNLIFLALFVNTILFLIAVVDKFDVFMKGFISFISFVLFAFLFSNYIMLYFRDIKNNKVKFSIIMVILIAMVIFSFSNSAGNFF